MAESQVLDKKSRTNRATAALFFSTFTGMIGGVIFGGFYGKHLSLLIALECAGQVSKDPACGGGADILLLRSIMLGLAAGAIIGVTTGCILYFKIVQSGRDLDYGEERKIR